jgi:predicted nucleic acid-binding protein
VTAYFFDSSALAKRYLAEKGSDWVRACFTDPPTNTVFIAEVTLVELAAAVARRVREGSLPRTYWREFRPLCMSHLSAYEIVPFNRSAVEMAMALCFKEGLRAYDAIQLYTAILVGGRLTAHGLAPLTFVSADKDLLLAATTPGYPFKTVDPNNL